MEIFTMDDIGTEPPPTQDAQSTGEAAQPTAIVVEPAGIADHPYLNDRWDIISRGLNQIWLEPNHRDVKLYMKMYQARWDFCTGTYRQPNGRRGEYNRYSQLYRRLNKHLQSLLSQIQTRVIDESATDSEAGLKLYLDEWQHFKQFAKQVDHICSVPGGWHNAGRSEYNWGRTPSVWSLLLARWKDAFFTSSGSAGGRTVSQIAEEYSEEADDPSPIMQPFQEIAALLERGPWGASKESFDPRPVDYSVLCPTHDSFWPSALGQDDPAVNK
jgi:hypothetical protein